jgi:hypothetical protein
MTLHYAYRLDEPKTGRFYFGCRTTRCCDPTNDRHYMGSGKWPWLCKAGKRRVTKTILAVFDNRNDAEALELGLIQIHRADALCMNIEGRRIVSKRRMNVRTIRAWELELKRCPLIPEDARHASPLTS